MNLDLKDVQMSYKSILVNIDIDGPIVPIVKAAVDLARRYEAKLIGLCGADTPLPMAVPEGGALVVEAWQQMRDEIEKRFKEVRSEFDRVAGDGVKTEWRESLANPTHAVVTASRSADLIVMAASGGASTGDFYRFADPASVVLRSGRPVLVIGSKVEQVQVRKVIVAWKDTREARRAIADAVPLLASADEVTVVTVADQADQWVGEGLRDVVAFLAAHTVKAKPKLIESPDEYITLFKFIDESDADLVVSGAYGHSRLREWAFGGVTRSLLDESGRNRFMSS
ncbi:universal stress protein [Mesorhizobium sp. CCNWLW179-1]|uniref:universal stress protein n=1 Tax=unclassified Mesorhizobium TaxID=325217 RepID=UPI003015433F